MTQTLKACCACPYPANIQFDDPDSDINPSSSYKTFRRLCPYVSYLVCFTDSCSKNLRNDSSETTGDRIERSECCAACWDGTRSSALTCLGFTLFGLFFLILLLLCLIVGIPIIVIFIVLLFVCAILCCVYAIIPCCPKGAIRVSDV